MLSGGHEREAAKRRYGWDAENVYVCNGSLIGHATHTSHMRLQEQEQGEEGEMAAALMTGLSLGGDGGGGEKQSVLEGTCMCVTRVCSIGPHNG